MSNKSKSSVGSGSLKKSHTTQKKGESKIKTVPPTLSEAFHLLTFNEDKVTSAGSDLPITRKLVDPEIPPSSLLMMKSMFGSYANKAFKVRMTRTATLTTSGAGAMALTTLVYPSQFDQYGALAALFSECRINATKISYSTNLNPQQTAAPVAGGTICSGFWPTAIVGSVSTVSSVVRLPKMKIFSTINTNWPITLRYKYPPGMPYSQVTASAGGLDPEGGIRGAWCHAALTTLSNTIAYLLYVIEVEYEFRTLI